MTRKHRLTNFSIALAASLLLVQCSTGPSQNSNMKGGDEHMPLDPAIKHGVKEVGAVRRFKVPDNWELSRHDENARGYVYEWNPQSDREVSLNVSWDGEPLKSSEAMQQMLAEAPHAVSSEELESIKQLLQARASAQKFKADIARTEDVSGHRVLRVSGNYSEDMVYEDTIFINSSGDGRIIQEVSFLAPTAKAAAYRKDVDQAFATLEIEQ